MVNYSTNEFKPGLKIIIDQDPCSIIDNEFVNPGKGQAFTRIKFRNLKTGRVLERTYKSGDSLLGADIEDIEVQYLYTDGEFWHFMGVTNFEQYAADKVVVAQAKPWLKEQLIYTLTLFNESPLAITAPNSVVLKITETDEGVRGNTISGGSKPATLETGVVIKVPLFVQKGESIKVDTRTHTYLSRD